MRIRKSGTPRETIRGPRFSGAMLLVLTGCATAPMDRAGSLKSYDRLAESNGILAKSLLRIDKAEVLSAKTVRIVPTVFSKATEQVQLSEKQRKLVANTVDRSLCGALSDRFKVVAPNEPADLTVHAVITNVAATDPTIAGVSKAASIVPMFLSLGFPVPVPRIPMGLGSLTLEAEANDRTGDQKAAMVWGRGADSLTSRPRVSEAADAYDLALSFGNDFGKLLVTGDSPFGTLPSPPSLESISARLGGAPKNPACEAFGRDPGLVGMIGGGIGLPPEWTDDGAAPTE
jgi:hypothetical protein